MQPRLLPTTRLLILVALGVLPLTLAARFPLVVWAVGAYDLALALLAALDYRLAPGPAAIGLTRQAGPRLAVGEREPVTILVHNQTPSPQTLELRDEAPDGFQAEGRLRTVTLPARGRGQAGYWVTPSARGDFVFPGLALRVPGPLGLVRRQWRLPLTTPVKVYPNFRLAGRMALLSRRAHLLRTGLHSLRRRGEGRAFETLREYVQGDDSRHIDWKATARRRRPIVREYEAERHQSILLMVDAGRMMTAQVGELTKLDCAVNAALLVAQAAVAHGDRVGVLTFAGEVLAYLPPRAGRGQVGRVLDVLQAVQPGLVEPDYAAAFRRLAVGRLQRSLVVVFTDLVDARASASLLRQVAALMPRHVALLIAIADPPLERHARAVPATVEAVYRQAVARELLYERAEALKAITARGGLALDVAPDALNLAAVNRYLEIKRRGIL